MIVSENDARKLIQSAYGADFKFKIMSKSITLGVRPVYDPAPSLAWIRLSPGLQQCCQDRGAFTKREN